ncbi:MAG TPA: hypothetical protein EYH19_06835 [Desulfocapsa sulfexigens]|nr:hypothetical protein [Desulfocapsa sulfexigens]
MKNIRGVQNKVAPHTHSIVADGLFSRSGIFYVMPKISLQPLADLFRVNVLAMLKNGRTN